MLCPTKDPEYICGYAKVEGTYHVLFSTLYLGQLYLEDTNEWYFEPNKKFGRIHSEVLKDIARKLEELNGEACR